MLGYKGLGRKAKHFSGRRSNPGTRERQGAISAGSIAWHQCLGSLRSAVFTCCERVGAGISGTCRGESRYSEQALVKSVIHANPSRMTRRRILHFGVTAHPTAEWTEQQLREAFPWDTAPRYLLRDRDSIFGHDFVEQVKAMGIKEVLSAPQLPRQRAYVERVIGTFRRECPDHVIAFNEASPYRQVRLLSRTITSLNSPLVGQRHTAGAAGAADRIWRHHRDTATRGSSPFATSDAQPESRPSAVPATQEQQGTLLRAPRTTLRSAEWHWYFCASPIAARAAPFFGQIDSYASGTT